MALMLTNIYVSFEDVFRGSRALRRLEHIVGEDPRFQIRVFHLHGPGTLAEGYGPIGADHYYFLMAEETVPMNELAEIADAVKAEAVS